jgi:glutamate racemase
MKPFDVAFCDTCIGGSTVLRRLARDRNGLRAFFLADYAVNPLGTRDRAGIRTALEGWVAAAAEKADTVIIACNTASVRLLETPDIVEEAAAQGVRVVSMVDLLDRALASVGSELLGKTVTLMGTEFTVGQPLYRDRLLASGVKKVIPLPATRTEALIARLRYTLPEAPTVIRDEVSGALRDADAVALACTCFPLISGLLQDMAPGIGFLDPAEGISGLEDVPDGGDGPNRLRVAVSGDVVSLGDVVARSEALFPGWEVDS